MSLRQTALPVSWRAVAKDAVDLPPARAVLENADVQVSVGETYDVEYETAQPKQLTLEGIQPNDTRRAVQTLVFTAPSR